MKTLLSFDEAKYNSQKEDIDSLLPDVQAVVTAFADLKFESLTSTEFESLFIQTDDLIYDKMTKGKPISFAGLEVEKSQVIQLIKKPTGYDELIQSITSANNALKSEGIVNTIKLLRFKSTISIVEIFELGTNNKVQVKQSVYDQLKASNELFATAERTQKLFELASIISEKCKEPALAEIVKFSGDGIVSVVKSIFIDHKWGNGNVEIDLPGIVKYNQPEYKY